MDVEQEKHIVREKKRLGIGFFTFSRSSDAQRYGLQYNMVHGGYVHVD